MSWRLVNRDRPTPRLLPADVQEWVQPDHVARFIVDAVDALDIHGFKVNEQGAGDAQYPPRMLLRLLAYSYATGPFSSRPIERASYENLPVRFICAHTHPDHDTICTFGRENDALLEESFVKVLRLARERKILKVGQVTLGHDGPKIQAGASQHSAVSYERAGQMIEELEREAKQLIAKAEAADSKPWQEGLSIPEEITRRQEREAQLQTARAQRGGFGKEGRAPAPGLEATIKEIMEHRLRSKEGKALYGLGKETVEPIFGIIKETRGFRRFSMRGQAKAALEWTLVTLSYNRRRLHCLQRGAKPGTIGRQNESSIGKKRFRAGPALVCCGQNDWENQTTAWWAPVAAV